MSRLTLLSTRCAVYIGELRELFEQRGLPVGSPGDINSLADRLEDTSFAEEMTSMIRSVSYREEAPLSRSEFMEMLAIAAGGDHFADSEMDLHEPLRRILNFVREILSSQRRGFDLEPARAHPPAIATPPAWDPPQDLEAPNLVTAALPAAHLTPVEPQDHLQATAPSQTRIATPPRIDETTPVHAEGFIAEDISSPPETARAAVEIPPQASGPSVNRGLLATLQRNYWLPGVGALALALASAGLLYRHWAGASQQAPVQPVSSPVMAPHLPKTSAYGAVLHRPANLQAGKAPDQSVITPRTTPAPPVQLDRPASLPVVTPLSPAAAAPRPTPHTVREPRPVPNTNRVPASNQQAASDPRETVFLSSSGIMASHLLFAPAPHYPKFASLTRVEGQVIVQVVVGRKGEVEATRVLEGPLLLRGAAEHAVRLWRYRPYAVDGRPTDVATIVTLSFRLRH